MFGARLKPHRSAGLQVRAGPLVTVVDQPGGLLGAEISLPALPRHDHRQAMQHRFCQRQAKALPSRRRDQCIGQGVQRAQGRIRQILFDQLDRRRRWELGTPIRQLLLDIVVRVREGFDDQHHRVLGGEGLAIGLE